MRYKIIISDYNDELAKRQPWYTVKCLKTLLEGSGCVVDIDSSYNGGYDCIKIKVFGIKDLWNPSQKKLLLTFPFYRFRELAKFKISELWLLRKSIGRILLLSIVPKGLLKRQLLKAELLICTSDRYDIYFSEGLENVIKWYPYSNDIELSLNKNNSTQNKPKIVVGYFGSPIYSRGFDLVLKYFDLFQKQIEGLGLRLITRIERKELLKSQSRLMEKTHTKAYVNAGFLNRGELKQELIQIDVFLLPFRFVLSEFPVVVVEALSLGKKVLVTRGVGFDRLLGDFDGVRFLDPDNEQNVSALIDFITTDVVSDFEIINRRIQMTEVKLINKLCQN